MRGARLNITETGQRRVAAHHLELGNARSLCLGQHEQAVLHENAVLSLKLHEIGQRAQRHKIQGATHVHARRAAFGKTGIELRHEKKRNADPGQRNARTIRQLGIAQHRRFRQLLRRQMMIGHHHIHAELTGPGNGRPVGNAAVHGEQHGNALPGKLFHAPGVHAVAFFPSVGQMPERVVPVMTQHLKRKRGARYAVGVVVSPDGKPAPRPETVGQHSRRPIHAGPQRRPRQMTQTGRKIFRQLFRSFDAAQPEQLRQTGRNAAPFGHIVKGNRNGRAVPACTEYPVLAHSLSTLPGIVVPYRTLP